MSARRNKPRSLKTVRSKRLDEVRYEGRLACGMGFLFAPRTGFQKKLAFIVAGYGSIDSSWRVNGRRETVPDGIAHFLEHQMFKAERGDLTDDFSERGAYVNAHTSHTATAYYFECVEQFEANLATLLELTLTRHFEPESVATECDIIVQEINQYRDHPGWVSFQQLLEALYVKHPLRIDIAGTEETVRRITPEMLNRCHATFYHPTNLTLIVSGDLDPQETRAVADRIASRFAPTGPAVPFQRERPAEPRRAAKAKSTRRMFLSRQRLLVGFKDHDVPVGRELTRREILTSLALDSLFSRGSDAYERLYAKQLIASDFGASFNAEAGYGYVIIGGETKDALALEKEIKEIIRRARREGIPSAVIERKRRKFLGRYLRNFNDPESTAYAYLNALAQQSDLFDFPELLESVTANEVNARMRQVLDLKHSATSVLLPQGLAD